MVPPKRPKSTWADAETSQPIAASMPPFIYLSGVETKTEERVFMVFKRTPRGWRCRSTAAPVQHDYEAKETMDELKEWLRLEFTHIALYNRATMSERIGSQCVTSKRGSTFLRGNPAHPIATRTEAVLQHLERGW